MKIKYSAILHIQEIYDWMQILHFLLVEPLPVNQNPGFLLATDSACQSNIWHVLVKRERVEKEKNGGREGIGHWYIEEGGGGIKQYHNFLNYGKTLFMK